MYHLAKQPQKCYSIDVKTRKSCSTKKKLIFCQFKMNVLFKRSVADTKIYKFRCILNNMKNLDKDVYYFEP